MDDGNRGSIGKLWKVGTRRGMAYAEGKDLAERILAASGQLPEEPVESVIAGRTKARKSATGNLIPGTMAVYSDKRGKPFAWQICFDVRHWETVLALMSGESV